MGIYQFLSTPAGYIFAATAQGVYYLDTGTTNTWQYIGDGIGKKVVFSLAINNEGRIFASVGGSGVYKSNQTFLTPHSLSLTFSKDAAAQDLIVYPNPISNNFQIAFSLDKRSSVSFELTDALGRIVATTNDAFYDAGTHTISFDASNLPSGVYYVTMLDGANTVSRKIVK